MKATLLLAVSFLLALQSHGFAEEDRSTARNPSSRRLAILVGSDREASVDADKLQALLEAEFFRSWKGTMVERSQIDALLDELRLNRAGLAAQDRIRLGRMLKADFFLLVRIAPASVAAVVNRFPDATVLSDVEYEDYLNEASLAKRIAVHAIKAINQDARDKSKWYVSIGSFLYDDPFNQYESHNDTLHQLLRKRLAKHANVVVNERYFVSHLLEEFTLARAGLTTGVSANVGAPPSDVLIIGDYRPVDLQKLDRRDAKLKFRVQLLSPTGLFPKREISFTIKGQDLPSAVSRIDAALMELAAEPSAPSARRAAGSHNEAEFNAIKQQVFQLLPNRPKHDGNFYSKNSYRGPWQGGMQTDLRPALRAVENAMLFKADDSQLMVCAAVALWGMLDDELSRVYRGRPIDLEQFPPKEKARIKRMATASVDYIENAYLLDPNENTRGVYCHWLAKTYPIHLRQRARAMAEHIVDSGARGGWAPHQTTNALYYLLRHSDDLDDMTDRFLSFAGNRDVNDRDHLRKVSDLLGFIQRYLQQHKEDAEITRKGALFASRLIDSDSAFLRFLGHYQRGLIYYHSESKNPKCLSQFRAMIDLIPAVYEEYGKDFHRCNSAVDILNILDHYTKMKDDRGLSDESFSLCKTYAASHLRIGNYGSSSLTSCLSILLPHLDRRGEYREGYRLLAEFLDGYTWSGSADFTRMELARWKNKFWFELDGTPRLDLTELRRIDLGSTGATSRIEKLLHAFDKVWVLQSGGSFRGKSGWVFSLDVEADTAARLAGTGGTATDIAASSEFLGVSTAGGGLLLIDGKTSDTVRYSRDNSTLPTNNVRTICSDGREFFVGLQEKGGGLCRFYALDPVEKRFRNCHLGLSFHAYYQTKPGLGPDPKSPISLQTWRSRTLREGSRHLRYTCKPQRLAVHSASVTEQSGRQLLEYEGVDLNYVYDFTLWHEQLVFATGNGLYVGEPGSNAISCILNELDLSIYSLCPVGEYLFVGTNKGLYRIDSASFLNVLPASEESAGKRPHSSDRPQR
ncbi:MAG: hypothetical protein ACYSWU_05705 [Planctomycetota bacterium]|jgi:hypothetical protein